jgi:hypothetical protein
MAVIAVCGRASGYRSGMMIKAARMPRLKKAVIHIHLPVFVFSLPLDSIVESSNMNSLAESSSGLDTEVLEIVPGAESTLSIPLSGQTTAGLNRPGILYEIHNHRTGSARYSLDWALSRRKRATPEGQPV